MPWKNAYDVGSLAYTCAYCGRDIASGKGFQSDKVGKVRFCSHCDKPTYFEGQKQVPSTRYGGAVSNVPQQVETCYEEARDCMGVSAFTAATLLCRKVLMNVAVSHGAQPGKSFQAYVEHLSDQGHIPPNSKGWVDLIRGKGNEATHDIPSIEQEDAEQMMQFTEMLLKILYEFPAQVPATTATGGT